MSIYLYSALLCAAPAGAALAWSALRGLCARRNAAWRAGRTTFRLARDSFSLEQPGACGR